MSSHAAPKNATYAPKLARSRLRMAFEGVFFAWLTPLLLRGYKKPLQQGDLYEIEDRFIVENTYAQFLKEWRQELQRRCHSEDGGTGTTTRRTSIWRNDFFNFFGVGRITRPSLGNVLYRQIRWQIWISI